MALEFLSARWLEHEAKRHAKAFDIEHWDIVGCDVHAEYLRLESYTRGLWLQCEWNLEEEGEWCLSLGDFEGVDPGEEGVFVQMERYKERLSSKHSIPSHKRREAQVIATRVLHATYLLGHAPNALETDLGLSLSAHEKMELRLSMPREFWPKTWLDEDVAE